MAARNSRRRVLARIVCLAALFTLCSAMIAHARPMTAEAPDQRPPFKNVPKIHPSTVDVWLSHRFVYSEGANNDSFGTAVSACEQGPTAVGAPKARASTVGTGAGIVRVYRWFYPFNTLVTFVNPEPGDGFGQSVAVSTAAVAVGSPEANGAAPASGAVFAYSYGSWTVQKLVGSGSATEDQFGWTTAIDGDTMVVGSPYADSGSEDAGAAHVFVRSGETWVEQAKLLASDRAPGDHFGWEVAISGDTIVIGASRADGSGTDTGAAYVFVRSGTAWSQQAKLLASDAQAGDFFGNAVSVDGEMAAVGANADDDKGLNAGATYVFTRGGSTWRQIIKLTAEDGAPNDYFGATVGVRNGTVAVGAPFDDTFDVDTGSVRIFADGGGGWALQSAIVPGDAIAYDNFGSAISFRHSLLVGSPFAVDWDDYSCPGATYYVNVTLPRADVHRFYNTRADTHFYTINEDEKRSVQQNLSHIFTYEGVAYSFIASKNTLPLHRFLNLRTGSHFYTVSESEKQHVISTMSHLYQYEGVAYRVTDTPSAPAFMVYRFYNMRTGTHFYTASETERDQVLATLGHLYQYDGPAFWVQEL